MIRQTNKTELYVPITKFNEQRYRVAFDKVDLEGELQGLSTWSLIDYISKPTTEQVQDDVVTYTQQRYINEGKEPPRREDIDLKPYVIE